MKTATIEIDEEGKIALGELEGGQIFAALRPLIRTMPDGSCTNTAGCACTISDSTCGN